jgi:peptidoglycan/LPS O-acetylase OafA/YrhL
LWYIVVPLTYLVSFAAAMALFYLIERPCVAQGRKLSRRMRQRIGGPGQLLPSMRASGNGVAVIEREEAGVPRAF